MISIGVSASFTLSSAAEDLALMPKSQIETPRSFSHSQCELNLFLSKLVLSAGRERENLQWHLKLRYQFHSLQAQKKEKERFETKPRH